MIPEEVIKSGQYLGFFLAVFGIIASNIFLIPFGIVVMIIATIIGAVHGETTEKKEKQKRGNENERTN